MGQFAFTLEEAVKRDMDLIRDLMLEIEAFEGNAYRREYWPLKPQFKDLNGSLLEYNLLLLLDAGFVSASRRPDPAGTPIDIIHGLTWQGCEFLETIRDPEIWRKTKEGAGKVGSASVSFLFDMGKAYARMKAKDLLGLDLG